MPQNPVILNTHYLLWVKSMNLNASRTFAVAMGKAILNSEDTDALLTGEEISSVGRMIAVEAILDSCDEGRRILADRPRLSSKTVDFDRLRGLPAGTIGHEYAAHLDREGLDPDALCVPVTRGPSDTANYLLERVRQTHDIWHTVLGLGAAAYQEVLVHAFQWPQLHMPYSALVIVFGTLKHYIGERRWPQLRWSLKAAYDAGAEAKPLICAYWEERWDQRLVDLRAEFAVRPAAEWRGLALHS